MAGVAVLAVYLSYLILYVAPDYSTALVGYPGHGYGWVLSRQRRMDAKTYQALLDRFAAAGYDVAKFRRIPQIPDQKQTAANHGSRRMSR